MWIQLENVQKMWILTFLICVAWFSTKKEKYLIRSNLSYFFFFTIATPSHNEGEDVYEDYESSTELQTVNQTNGTGLLKNNQVSIENLKVI